jgi:hypothetical protein
MRRTRVTPLRYLAATDVSGGVARQQKITHAHESPFYHYAQFPHPFAITYRGKKYSRILFGQPSYDEMASIRETQYKNKKSAVLDSLQKRHAVLAGSFCW